jgi:hypothetical protein
VDVWVTYNQFQEILGRLTDERVNEEYFHNRGYSQSSAESEYLVHLPKEKLKRGRQSRSNPTLYQEMVCYLDIVLKELNDDD